MGLFREEITLKNAGDVTSAQRGYIKEPEIRETTVAALVDTGAWTLVINEEIRQALGLTIARQCKSTLADGKSSSYPLTEAVTIQWKDRDTVQQAVVVAGAKDVLLGALPLEAMDLIVDPVRQQLTGAHGDQAVHILY